MSNIKTKTQTNWTEIFKNSEKTHFNLYDVIPMEFELGNVKNLEYVIEAEIVKDEDTLITTLIEAKQLLKSIKSEDYNLNSITASINKTLENIKKDYFEKNGKVPKQLIPKHSFDKDIMDKISELPRTNLKNIRKIVEKLGLMIIPSEYFDFYSATKDEPYSKRTKIYSFTDELKYYFDIYVISPLVFWDISAMVKSEKIKNDVYASSKLKDVVAAVKIQLPLLREFQKRITDLENRMESYEENFINIQHTISDIKKSLKDFQEQLNRINERERERLKEIKELKIYIDRKTRFEENERFSFSAVDPMLFAVKKGQSLYEDSWAIVGPAWGPDFDFSTLYNENILPLLNQREIIEKNYPKI
jgi:DNA repair exonuclease SbcCD ATPase subunit